MLTIEKFILCGSDVCSQNVHPVKSAIQSYKTEKDSNQITTWASGPQVQRFNQLSFLIRIKYGIDETVAAQ